MSDQSWKDKTGQWMVKHTDPMKYWPVYLLLGGALITFGEMRWELRSLRDDLERTEQVDQAQWERIGELMRNQDEH